MDGLRVDPKPIPNLQSRIDLIPVNHNGKAIRIIVIIPVIHFT